MQGEDAQKRHGVRPAPLPAVATGATATAAAVVAVASEIAAGAPDALAEPRGSAAGPAEALLGPLRGDTSAPSAGPAAGELVAAEFGDEVRFSFLAAL